MIRSSMVRPMMYYVVWRGPVAAVAVAVQRFNATPTRDGQAMRWTELMWVDSSDSLATVRIARVRK